MDTATLAKEDYRVDSALALAEIRTDGGTQMREAIDEATVQQYAEHLEDGDEFPAIVVFYDGEAHWLADGFHRLAAYKRAGYDSAPADVRSGQRVDALRFALKANATNGKPRTPGDMARAYEAAVSNGLCDGRSVADVRDLLGCSKRWAEKLTKPARDEGTSARDTRIRELAAQGYSQRQIAEAVGCDQATVSRVMGDAEAYSTQMHQADNADDAPPASDPSIFDNTPSGQPDANGPVQFSSAKEAEDWVKERKRAREQEKQAERRRWEAENQRVSQIGSVVLHNEGNADFANRFEDQSVDLLITDPPYMHDVEGDFQTFASWVKTWLPKVKPTGRAYIFAGAYPEELQVYLNHFLGIGNTPGCADNDRNCVLADGYSLENVLVWTYRNTLGPSPNVSYKMNWQACFYLVGEEAPALDCPVMTEQFSVQDINAPDSRHGVRWHAWQKPDEIAERFIRHSTQEGATVVDPFCGTGTFVAAASRLGRNAVGADIDPEMLDICHTRGLEVSNAG